MSEGHTDATHCKKCGGWFKAGAGRVFLGGECFHLECAPVPDEKIDMPFMPIVGDEHAFQALRDLARSQADALTAKDAEIERLRKGNDAMKRMLASIAPEQIPGPFICGAVGEPGDDGLHDGYLICPTYGADWTATYRREAAVPRQEPRSGVSGHGEPPDTPTGDTRG